ncbi:hypothetical protein Bbelb_035010 [Branchiostoma belcheri]|nr:hypothetical protein Bbelb_035010 [Branchiostoma belcheri]
MLDDNRLRGSARRAAVASARLILRNKLRKRSHAGLGTAGGSPTPGGSQRAMEPAETPDPTLHSSTSVVRQQRRPDSPSAGARGLRYKLRYHCQTSLLAIRDAEMLHQAWDIYLLAEARVGEVSATL